MTHYVYLLKCRDKNKKETIYCGYTSRTPSARLKDHIKKIKSKSRKSYVSRQEYARVVYYEKYKDRKTAMKREREIKKLGTAYKKGLIDGMKNKKKE